MADKLPKVSLKAWAWIASVAFHLILIGVFAFIKFSRSADSACNNSSAVLSIDQLKSITSSPLVAPKPQIKKALISQNTAISKKATKLPENPDKNSTFLLTTPSVLRAVGSASILSAGKIPDANVTFFGHRINDRKICYIVDCSGSMHGLLGKVQTELKKAVTNLRPDQYFYIIFFLEGDKLIESGQGFMTRATDSAKENAISFIDSAKLSGPSNAANAVERAMRIKDPSGCPPETIYFLTDGFDMHTMPDDSLTKRIQDLRNQIAPHTVINTIGFWTTSQDRMILENISEQSGGKFLDVSVTLND